MPDLRLTTIQSPNSEFIPAEIAKYLAVKLGREITFVGDIPWEERERGLDSGEIQIGWICGLPYVRKMDTANPNLELLAAPVMTGERYKNQPIYFSDVVVQTDRPYQTFADLRGVTWAYNEPGSQSGYNITRYHLSTMGETRGYFGRVIAAGSHENCLRLLLKGRIDAAAIDSTVLEIEYDKQPDIQEKIRVVQVLGPSPIPPYVVSKSLSGEVRTQLRQALLTMHDDPQGQQILHDASMLRFAPVQDSDYDLIRRMAQAAQNVVLDPSLNG